MKKVILTIVAALMMTITPAMAQIFIDDDECNGSRILSTAEEVGVMVPEENVFYDQFVPIGEGLLLLSGLGIAYLLGKQKKKE